MLSSLYKLIVSVSFITMIYANSDLNKFLAITNPLLGTAYVFDPWGDIVECGPGHAKGVIHSNALDCVSFVDLTLSKLLEDKQTSKNHILEILRYKKKPYNWFNRNHFTIPDWTTASATFLKNIEAPGLMKKITIEYNAKSWWSEKLQDNDMHAEQRLEILKKVNENYQATISTTYWPWSNIIENNQVSHKFYPYIKNDWSVILFIRENYPRNSSIPLLVSHVGFLWDNSGTIMLRHAGRTYGVEDIPLVEYYNSIKSDTHIGLVILKVPVKQNITDMRHVN